MKRYAPFIQAHTVRFLAVFFVVFFLSAVVLFAIDFVPEQPIKNGTDENESAQTDTGVFVESPTRIVIEDIGVDTDIANPSSTAIATLDEALLDGAVRYPGSALLGERATMFLFGHQSYLPVVKNKAFKAFNGLQKLSEGAVIRVYSDTAVYEYAVRSVSKVLASDALIPLSDDGQNLFLSTCNSFGDPGERYVVEAEYLARRALN